MIIAGYILSIYQFMLEEHGQSVIGFTPVRRRGTSSQTQVSSTHTHTPVQRPLVWDYPGEPVLERYNQSGFY